MKGRNQRVISVCASILLSLAVFAWVVSRRQGHYVDDVYPTTREAQNIAFAISQYFSLFAAHPGGNSSAIAKALGGENPKKIVFLKLKHISRDGEWLDPWRHPYDIRISEDGLVQIRSAGPNGIMGDKDDTLVEERLGEIR